MRFIAYELFSEFIYIPLMWTIFPGPWRVNGKGINYISGVLIVAFCDSDDSRWLSFPKWLLVQREKIGILEDC